MKITIDISNHISDLANELNEYFVNHLNECTTAEQREKYIQAAMLVSILGEGQNISKNYKTKIELEKEKQKEINVFVSKKQRNKKNDIYKNKKYK